MGKLVDGVWHDRWYDTKSTGGRFVRSTTQFREQVCDPAVGRYHLYASLACPWAHRVLLVRKLLGLEQAIAVSFVEPLMLENGWEFSERFPEHLYGADYLHQIYTRAKPDYTGRVTVPVLWDTERETIANNESAEIIRIFNDQFRSLATREHDFYPEPLRAEIDALNAVVYDKLNNGVYRAGFATAQEAHEEAAVEVFEMLDELEQRLEGRDYLVGDRLTEADVRAFPTLVRFDPVYHGHFKCNLRRLIDYPNLCAFTERIAALPGVRETIDMAHTKRHYYGSHRSLNPSGIVPAGPARWAGAPR